MRSTLGAWTLAIAAALAPLAPGVAGAPAAAAMRAAEPAGEVIYRQGRLPSGAPLVGRREGSSTVEGEAAACIRCHRRSGLGAMEGRASIPPVGGLYLFAPSARADSSDIPVVDSMRIHRTPYTEATLARVIRDGVDPDGRALDYLMPRFDLDPAATASLIRYLRALDPRGTPGVTDTVLHFATVVTPDADPVKREAMLAVLSQYFDDKNAAYRNESKPLKSARSVRYRVARRWQLHVWALNGAPDTWEAQLAAHLKAEPVFAVISGIAGRTWAPVHRFCERAQLPCLLPNVEVPDTSPGDVYTVYFSAGVLLEAKLIAGRLAEAGAPRRRLVQVYRPGDVGEAGAGALAKAVAADGISVVERRLAKGEGLAEALKDVGRDDALVLWLRPKDLAALARVPEKAATVYVSGTMGDLELAPLPASWRAATRMVYLVDLPATRQVRIDYQIGWFVVRKIKVTSLQVQSDTLLACGLLAETLGHMVDTFQRDYLVEQLDDGVEHRILSGYYPRLTLGIGQRFASKGGYFVRFPEPSGSSVAPEGSWTIP